MDVATRPQDNVPYWARLNAGRKPHGHEPQGIFFYSFNTLVLGKKISVTESGSRYSGSIAAHYRPQQGPRIMCLIGLNLCTFGYQSTRLNWTYFSSNVYSSKDLHQIHFVQS